MSVSIANPPAEHNTAALSAIHQNGHTPANVAALVDEALIMPESPNSDGDDLPEPRSPLAIEPVKDLRLGWIDEYTKLMTNLTGSPSEFNRLAGLVTAATALQRKARLRMSFADIYPNIYACIIAPSSVYHKSSAIHKPRAMLQRAMMDKLQLSELMTSEGLLKQLQGQSSGVILRDEVGTLFDSQNTKYLRQLKPDLTAIYDCYPYSRSLAQGEIKVDKPYLNILGATTPTRFYDGITLTDWQDGFLARWLFVLPEGEPNFDAMTSLYLQAHEDQVQRLALKLVELDRHQETDFILKDNAHELWHKWQIQAAKDAFFYGDDITAAIVTRYSAYALKFALILTALNGDWGTITPETMQTAIHLADYYKAYVYRLLSEKRNYGISGAKLQKVFSVIKSKNSEGKGVTTKVILQSANMKKSELEPCLEKLLEIGAVYDEKAGNGKRFVPIIAELPIKTWR